ncbi:alginate o-acetyltransferase AlgF [Pseudomonas aeruginosa 18A]|nr:alginate O-acetyl transferase AlgF family protein [Pseudomonas aeruginosa PAK]CCQ89109.1 alginate o-acetyltransferase AlgF [Pseudomonas aeruginosa 18A]
MNEHSQGCLPTGPSAPLKKKQRRNTHEPDDPPPHLDPPGLRTFPRRRRIRRAGRRGRPVRAPGTQGLGLRPRLQRRQQRTRRVGRQHQPERRRAARFQRLQVPPPGSYTAQVGQQSLPVKLDPDSYYTLVSQPGGKPQLVAEPPFKNKQKALVRVQNLSGSKLTLKTADGKTDVVKDVGPQSHGDREINPVKVNLALFDGSKKVSDLKPVTLARGEVVCLYVTGSGGKLAPVWVKRPVKAD